MGTAISSGRATVSPIGALGPTTSGNAIYDGHSTCALGGSCSSSVLPSIFASPSSSVFGSSGLLNLRVNRFRKDRRAVKSVTNARLNDKRLSGRSSSRVLDLNDKRAVLCRVRESSVGRQVGRNRRGSVRVFVDVGGTGNTGKNGDTVLETLEQSRRLLAMQKALLKQVEDRKQLYAALGRNVRDPSDQEKLYDNADMTIQKQSEESAGAHGELSELDNLQPDSSVVKDKSIESSGDFLRKPGRQTPLAATWPSAVSPGMPSPSIMQRVAKAAGSPTNRSPIQPLSHSAISSVAPSSSPVVTPASNWRPKSNPIIPPSSPRSAPDADRPEQGAVVESQAPSPLAGPNVMNVVLVAAECAPWSKTGGLGEVVGALPKALARRGHRVMVVAPRYSNYMEAWDTSVRKVYSVAGQEMEIGYFHGYRDGVDFVFVDSPMFHAYSSNIYGGSREDVLLRMILLCKAAVEAPWHVPCGGVPYGDGNLVFIANDWHTALLPVYLQAYYQDNGLMSYTRCILVIHNLAHQGRGPISDFGKFGLPAQYADKFRLYDPIGGDHCNVFKAGFMTSHRIVTVSQGYAHEVQTREGGWGLDGVIRDHSWKLRGVVNGIDDQEWNPQIDPCLKDQGYRNYSQGNLAGKAACKAALQNELGLPARSSVPLIGFIGRLDFQKGVDIIAEAMPWMMSQDLQLVMLGTGRKDLEDMLRTFECQYKDKVRGWVGFSVKTAHRITAGVDILLMPSRFEPCGLNQLYAMRYGTIPIVHSVGGLRDTVHPFDPFAEAGTGWTFDRAEASGLIHALGNAMWTYHDFKPSWEALQKRGMAQDLSWDNAAQLYEEVLVAAKYQW